MCKISCECHITGCRNLQTTCVSCGRIVCTRCLPKSMEWISVKDLEPELYTFVLVFANNQGTNEPKPIAIARIDARGKWNFSNHSPVFPNYGAWQEIEYNMDSDDVTHWMPLPEPPE